MGICMSCRRGDLKAPEKKSLPVGRLDKGSATAELLPQRLYHPPAMANSISNIKMTNPLKNMVSKRRKRYIKDGFNLDLAYITDRLIAMGFPAEKLEGVYRNHIDEVYRFLEQKHRDHYKIYNLCSERTYDAAKFHDRVGHYRFDDHSPPNMELIQPFCEDVHNWLSLDPRNVAAVHCKAGKGRTGTMVSCYLLYCGQKNTADEALKFYGIKRAHDEKGVTIPSQRRYVSYYAWLLRSGLRYGVRRARVRQLLVTPPADHAALDVSLTQAKPHYKVPLDGIEIRRTETEILFSLSHTQAASLAGDVRVDVYRKNKMKMRKEKLFHFWFNTFFVFNEVGAKRIAPMADSEDGINLETYKLTLNKWELDDAHKDKQNKHYSPDFKVEVILEKLPPCAVPSRGQTAPAPALAPAPAAAAPDSDSSSSSEEPDANWDSGESTYL